MAKLWIFSDVHARQSLWVLPPMPANVDVIVPAGDIRSPATRSIEKLADDDDEQPPRDPDPRRPRRDGRNIFYSSRTDPVDVLP